MYASKEAMDAVKAEGDGLLKKDTWLPETVIRKGDLIKRSLHKKVKIVMGDLLITCSIKHWENPAKRRAKARMCFRGDCAKDEHGKAAVYQDLGASPAGIFDINANIAYGCCPGNMTTASDALQAYLQSHLKSANETWLAIPEELWPADGSWQKLGFKNYGDHRPMCRLNKALYGHPEAGGHWERHLTKALLELGFTKVPEHKSTFWFAEAQQLLTIYVDDLLLSGPAHSQHAVWEKIRSKVDTEKPEPLERYLGRTHVVAPNSGSGRHP